MSLQLILLLFASACCYCCCFQRGTSFLIATAKKKTCPASLLSARTVSTEHREDVSNMNALKVKEKLVDLLPRMTGKEAEYRKVEAYVNRLEQVYQPAQTLDFFNLAVQGTWQLLFSTNLSGTPNPMKFRLRELTQTIHCQHRQGTVHNVALWDLAEECDGKFEATGHFTIQCHYEIEQGARMQLCLDDHVLKPSRGSQIPNDVQGLVGLLHRSMPKELFDPSEHSVDTTYLDTDLRIIRYTGPRFEGCRDIFVRASAFALDPTAKED